MIAYNPSDTVPRGLSSCLMWPSPTRSVSLNTIVIVPCFRNLESPGGQTEQPFDDNLILSSTKSAEKRILYVDDDPDDREIFTYALNRCQPQITLTMATDANDALEKLAILPKPDCIYLDMNMPKVNGMQLLEMLKADSEFEHIPVIIFSTAVDAALVRDAIKLGATAVVGKPSSLHNLFVHLETALLTYFEPVMRKHLSAYKD